MNNPSLTLPNAEQTNILTIQTMAKLHLSDAEYKALDLIAKVYDCTIEEVINTIIHRSTQSELETAAPASELRHQLRAEWDRVFEDATRLEKKQKEASEIEVTVTLDLSKNRYESFRRMFDAQTERYFFSNSINSHLGEINGDNPDLMADYLKWQNERLYGKQGA